MRAGRLEEASSCIRQVVVAIECRNGNQLKGIDPTDGLSELWHQPWHQLWLKDYSTPRSDPVRDVDITVEEFNTCYVTVSSDLNYVAPYS